MYDEEEEVCALCGGTDLQIETGWFGSPLPLCKSCRQVVVTTFSQRYPKVEPGPTSFYKHVNLPDEHRSLRPWPYHGYEAKVHSGTYTYYQRMRDFICQEVARPEQERQPYLTATAALRQSRRRTVQAGDAPTKKLSPTAQAEADKRQYRQTMLFADFPP